MNTLSAKYKNLPVEEFEKLKEEVVLGNQDSITELYRYMRKFMFKRLSRYGFEQDDKEYCADLAFTLLLKREPISIFDLETFKKYLWGMCKHVGWHLYRDLHNFKNTKNKETCSYDVDDCGDSWIDAIPSYYELDRECYRKEQLNKIIKVVNSFKVKLARQCFYLRMVEGHSNQEVADILNISLNSVTNHMARVRKYIRERGFTYEEY